MSELPPLSASNAIPPNALPLASPLRPVFISYNSRDMETVGDLVNQLKAANIPVLWDQDDLERKGRWQKELFALIQQSGGALVFCGPHGPGQWQEEEIDACLLRKKKDHDFEPRAVWLPGVATDSFAGFLDNYDRVDLRAGVRVEPLLARLCRPRPAVSPAISETGQGYGPWPDSAEARETSKAFGQAPMPAKNWRQLDPGENQRAHLAHRLDDPKVRARWSLDDLNPEERDALELIHTARLLPRIDYLAALWTRPWSSLADKLVKRGLLGWQEDRLVADAHVAAYLEQDAEAIRRSHEQWIECLMPLADHWDLALELCLHLLFTKRYSELISIAHDHMFAAEELWVRKFICQMLDALANKPSIWRQIKPLYRVLLLDAQGVHRLNQGETDAAFKLFTHMGSIAAQGHDHWGIAQSWLHRGLVWYARKNLDQAARCYQRAAEQAAIADDEALRGRALHNRAQCLMERDPIHASALLAESAECKRRAGDKEGLFATYDAQGLLAIQSGDLAGALRWFRRAVKLARSTGWRRNLAHGLHNLANVHHDLGHHTEARQFGEEAYALAHDLEAHDLMILTTQGLAMRCHLADDNERASILFAELAELKCARGDYEGAVLALSDAGATRVRLGDPLGARDRLDQAIVMAREHGILNLLPQAFGNYAASYGASDQTEAGLAWLGQASKEAAQLGEWLSLSKLATIEAPWRDERGDDPKAVRACWDQAVNAAVNSKDFPLRLEVMQNRYAWIRDRLGADAALPAVEELAALLARRRQHAGGYAAALNELGNILQTLERFGEARRHYQKGLNVLNRVEDIPLRASVLNNLGEMWRKTDQFAKAIACYRQALELHAEDDPEERFSTEHNLALAEAESGETQAAETRLLRIRDLANKQKLWPTYAKAWLALGDLAWTDKRHNLALQRYAHAIRHSVRHGLDDWRLQAELNRAHLLLGQDRPAEAVAHLSSLRTLFSKSPYCVELHLALADAFSHCQQVNDTLNTLRQALACDGQNDAQRAEVHAALAHALFASGDPTGAWEQMTQAMCVSCPAEQRADILVDAAKLAVVLDQDVKDDISEHVQTVIDLVQAESQWELPLRRHFWSVFGDTLWESGKHGEASVSYIKGMIEGIQNENLSAYFADGIHLLQRLHRIGKERTGIEDEARCWLNRQGLTKPAEIANLLWPFTLAEQSGTDTLEPDKIISLVLEIWKRDDLQKEYQQQSVFPQT